MYTSMKKLAFFALVALLLAALSAIASAQTENILHAFTGTPDGAGPDNLLQDHNGNLYGVTGGGGNGYGTVYQLSPSGSGKWHETILYAFTQSDGKTPIGSLIMDSNGNLYGATQWGGSYNRGIVFELSPTPNGTWNETILHSFGHVPSDGVFPQGSLYMDPSGNLLGTTQGGGGDNCTGGCGTAFELTPSISGEWTEKIIFDFDTSGGRYGLWPNRGLIPTAPGVHKASEPPQALYGTTFEGVTGCCEFNGGVVFQLIPPTPPGDQWTMEILHTFPMSAQGFPLDGFTPLAGLFMDGNGNLFGTTQQGGVPFPGGGGGSYGTVFEVSPPPEQGGDWTEQVIYAFPAWGAGYFPASAVVEDSSGNLYSTTFYGGLNACFGGCGTVFELSNVNGSWQETVLLYFNGQNGLQPLGVLVGPGDSLYGVATGGGPGGFGLVYQLEEPANNNLGALSKTTLGQ